jgi:O-antigen ligase/tetratricopeptide (TPR) repeat protein
MLREKIGLVVSKGYIILLLFIWCLPNYNSIDIIGSQWFHLGIMNIVGLLIIWFTWSGKTFQQLFSNKITPLFFGLFLWGLGSYFYANNQTEVLIESSRIASLFILLITLGYFFKRFSISFKFLANLFLISLISEVGFVIILNYLEHGTLFGLNRSELSTGITGNINIASYSILYKLPFVLYLFSMTYSKVLKYIIILCVTLSSFLIFSYSTRSAFITLIIVVLVYNIFIILQKGKISKTFKAITFSLFLPLAVAFSTVQLTTQDDDVNTLTDRLATINLTEVADESSRERLSNYKGSLEHFIANPMFGMGLGNWKINSIPFSMENKKVYIVPYHTHNDFIQYLSELGIIGFIFYAGFLLFTLIYLIRHFNKKRISSQDFIPLLIFSIIYFMDASFNFPYSRVIIQIYLMICVAFILSKNSASMNAKLFKSKTILLLLILISPILLYSHYRVLNSFIQQKVLMKDFNTSSLSVTSEEALSYESNYPNISITTLPLKALKATYFINSGKKEIETALRLASSGIKDNPYISFNEVLMARIYAEMGIKDSSKHYAKQAYYMMPSVELNVASYLPFVKSDKDTVELYKMKNALLKSNSRFIWGEYLKTVRSLKDSLSDIDKKLIKIALDRFPDYPLAQSFNLTKEYSINQLKKVNKIAKRAEVYFNEKNYSMASKLFSEAYEIIPNESSYLENQARSAMYSKKYKESIDLFKALVKNHKDNTGLPEYYMSAMYYTLGEQDESCQILRIAIKKGYSPAKALFEKTCLK